MATTWPASSSSALPREGPSNIPRASRSAAELTPEASLACHLDRAAQALNEALAERKAQPGPHPGGLGGEERIENLRDELAGVSLAIVLDHDLQAGLGAPGAHLDARLRLGSHGVGRIDQH